MPTLTPVDNDPFAPPSGSASPKLTPVDHDPFATTGSGTSSQSAQPGWSDYLLQHLAGQAGPLWDPNAKKTLGTTAFWDKPADVSWGNYMAAHAQPVDDFVRSATNTFGLGNRFAAGMSNLTGVGGGDLAAQRAQSDVAAQRDPSMATAGSIVGGLPVSELGFGAKIGEAALPYVSKLPLVGQGKWLSGVLGAGTEGVGTAEAGAYGRTGEGASPLEVAAGALSGVPGGVVGRGGALAAPISEDALRATASQKYAPLDEMVFHGPSQVKPALDAVTNTMTQSERDLAASTMAKVNKLADTNLATGSDIQKYQKIFGGLAKTGSDTDREYAPQFKSALESVMQADPYGRNLTPGQGMSLMPAGTLGGTGFATGAAATARDAGDVFHGQANDVARLNDWITRSKVSGGPDVGDQARSYILSKGGFAKPGTPGYDALNTLAGTGAGKAVDAAPSAWDIRHGVHPLVSALAGAAVTGAGGQVASGHFDPASLAAETATGALLGYTLHRGVPAFQSKFLQGPAQQRAIDAARTALSTGQPQAPVMPPAPLRDAIRALIYGQGAAGRY